MNKTLFEKLKRNKRRKEEFAERYRQMQIKSYLRQKSQHNYARQIEEKMFFQFGNEVTTQ